MVFNKNKKAMVCSSDDETDFFGTVTMNVNKKKMVSH